MVEDDALINLNLATVEVLADLPGIGLHLAERIVAYRESVHPFQEVIELTAVSGISERMVRQFEDRVTVGTVAEPTPQPEPDESPPTTAVSPAIAQENAIETAVNTTVFTSPPISRRRGCLFTILAALLGAMLGIGATLGILALLNNGTLAFSQTDARIEAELAGAQAAQGDLAAQVEQLNRALSAMATRTGELAGQQNEADTAIATLQAEAQTLSAQLDAAQTGLDTAQSDVAALETTTESLGEEIEAINIAADTFTTFLDRLRTLLLDLEIEPTETAVPTATPAATTATPTPIATRTPRPTATPFTEPTATP